MILTKAFATALILILLGSCASALKSKSELGEAPEKMQQKIEEVTVQPKDALVAQQAPELAASTEAAKNTKTKKASKTKKPSKPTTPEVVKETESPAEPKQDQSPFVSEWPFGIGEKITLVIRYGPIEGGKATLEVAPIKKVDGELVMNYVAHAQSHKVFDLFYRVDDVLQSWARLKDHLPVRQEIEQNESGEWGRRVVIFNQKKKEQHFYSSTTRPGKPVKVIDEKHQLFNNPQDMLGGYYFSRFIKNPKKINFPVHDRFKHWNNEYVYEDKEEVKTKAGTFMCNRYRVYPRVQGNLEPRGDALVWMSDDSRKILTRFKVKIRIGSITGDLVAYEPGKVFDIPLPKFATPLNLDPSKIVEKAD